MTAAPDGGALRVALVVPSQAQVYGPIRPPSQLHLGIAYLAAAVEDLCRVTVIDIDAERLTPEGFAALLRAGAFDIVGFSVATPVFPQALELARIVRRELPAAWVVFGGYHPTLRPEEVMAHDCVDLTVVGEGEETFRALVVARGEGRSAAGIPGLVHRTATGEIRQEPLPRFDRDRLDRLPWPARHLFSPHYNYPDALYPRVAPIITSRGCPGRCSYCSAPEMYRGKCHFRSPAGIADEIEDLVRRRGYQEIHIWDDNFTTRPERVFALRDELRRRSLRVPIALPGGIRADSVSREVMTALRAMGVYSLAVGVESGVQELLNGAGKGITLEQVRCCFAWARECGIETWAFFLFGLPGETPATLRRSIDFALELDPDVVKFHIVKPYPGTRIYDTFRDEGWLLTADYAALGIHLHPVHQLPDLAPQELVDWQKRAYREFYFGSPRRLWRQLRRIRSWHRFKVNLSGGLSLLRLLKTNLNNTHRK